jgi:hypothetical protein
MRCAFIPGYLLERIAATGEDDLAHCGRRTREIDERLRADRAARGPATASPHESVTGAAAWQVHDAHNTSSLPGDLVRSAGDPDSGDPAVDEAGTGLDATLALFEDLGRSSYDGNGATVLATVHYEKDYDNAFWDGTQLVFGDGDGKIFERFTKPVDVLGHEFTHAVTQYTANLTYSGQSGALNESVSDVFGSCVKQRVLGQDAAAADWLIGEGIFLPSVHGKALRSMKAPGTAYDDPRLGKDPQVGSMADYVETTDDNGGVHLNSGIPNRAFYLAATGIGGTSWDGAGSIWYAALTSGLPADCDFATFAAATVSAAGDHQDTVRSAWQEVGLLGDATPGAPTGGAPGNRDSPVATGTLVVRRSGGFAGIVREGHLDLDRDEHVAGEARDLLARVDFSALPDTAPRPDRFVYDFELPSASARVHEPDLTPELAQLARLVLGDG